MAKKKISKAQIWKLSALAAGAVSVLVVFALVVVGISAPQVAEKALKSVSETASAQAVSPCAGTMTISRESQCVNFANTDGIPATWTPDPEAVNTIDEPYWGTCNLSGTYECSLVALGVTPAGLLTVTSDVVANFVQTPVGSPVALESVEGSGKYDEIAISLPDVSNMNRNRMVTIDDSEAFVTYNNPNTGLDEEHYVDLDGAYRIKRINESTNEVIIQYTDQGNAFSFRTLMDPRLIDKTYSWPADTKVRYLENGALFRPPGNLNQILSSVVVANGANVNHLDIFDNYTYGEGAGKVLNSFYAQARLDYTKPTEVIAANDINIMGGRQCAVLSKGVKTERLNMSDCYLRGVNFTNFTDEESAPELRDSKITNAQGAFWISPGTEAKIKNVKVQNVGSGSIVKAFNELQGKLHVENLKMNNILSVALNMDGGALELRGDNGFHRIDAINFPLHFTEQLKHNANALRMYAGANTTTNGTAKLHKQAKLKSERAEGRISESENSLGVEVFEDGNLLAAGDDDEPDDLNQKLMFRHYKIAQDPFLEENENMFALSKDKDANGAVAAIKSRAIVIPGTANGSATWSNVEEISEITLEKGKTDEDHRDEQKFFSRMVEAQFRARTNIYKKEGEVAAGITATLAESGALAGDIGYKLDEKDNLGNPVKTYTGIFREGVWRNSVDHEMELIALNLAALDAKGNKDALFEEDVATPGQINANFKITASAPRFLNVRANLKTLPKSTLLEKHNGTDKAAALIIGAANSEYANASMNLKWENPLKATFIDHTSGKEMALELHLNVKAERIRLARIIEKGVKKLTQISSLRIVANSPSTTVNFTTDTGASKAFTWPAGALGDGDNDDNDSVSAEDVALVSDAVYEMLLNGCADSIDIDTDPTDLTQVLTITLDAGTDDEEIFVRDIAGGETLEEFLARALASCTVNVVDTDGDGVLDNVDACVDTPGYAPDPALYQGCPVADKNEVVLHTVYIGPGGTSSQAPIAGAEVKVFDRNLLNGLQITLLDNTTETLTKNPTGTLYDDIFESTEAGTNAQVGSCDTDVNGICYAGEEYIGDFLVLVKYVDPVRKQIVYTGLPKSPSDFEDTDLDGVPDLAYKYFAILKKVRGRLISWGGGKKTVVSGSQLDIISPIMAEWDEGASSYIYPFIFTSDDNWEVDICSRVPQGYEIAGTYDENGNLLTADHKCVQTFVSGETKVVAFDIIQTGSPPVWAMNTKITVKGPNGRAQNLDLNVPSVVLEHAQGVPFGDNPVHDQ